MHPRSRLPRAWPPTARDGPVRHRKGQACLRGDDKGIDYRRAEGLDDGLGIGQGCEVGDNGVESSGVGGRVYQRARWVGVSIPDLVDR